MFDKEACLETAKTYPPYILYTCYKYKYTSAMTSSHSGVNHRLYATTMGTDNGNERQGEGQGQAVAKRAKTNCLQQACGCRYRPSVENLEYDYTKGENQPLPRIRQRGEFYVDRFNGETWSCALGTNEEVRF